jgi:sugar phosphate isomerase/epimerase
MKPVLALSSCWNSFRHTDGYTMLREIADLGFSHAELSHGIRIVLVPGILKAVEEGFIKISSTHNFCPLPAGIMMPAPNLFEPSAPGDQEREQWLRQTKRSLDFAAQVKARVLVCHLGSVRFFWLNPARKLKALREANSGVPATEDLAYQAVLRKAVAKLRKRAPDFWQRVKDSILAVHAYANERGVRLGFENREKFEELPIDDEFNALLDSLPTPAAGGYWHDTGHAHIKETLGLLSHRAHLEKVAPRLLGFHLHDVSDAGKDHQPVGSGKVDFKMISSFWRPEQLLTLEFSPRLTVEEVRWSKERIEKLMAEAPGLA